MVIVHFSIALFIVGEPSISLPSGRRIARLLSLRITTWLPRPLQPCRPWQLVSWLATPARQDTARESPFTFGLGAALRLGDVARMSFPCSSAAQIPVRPNDSSLGLSCISWGDSPV